MQSAYELVSAMLKFCFNELTYEEFRMLQGRCDASAELKQKQQAQQQAKINALLQNHSNIEIIKCNGKSE